MNGNHFSYGTYVRSAVILYAPAPIENGKGIKMNKNKIKQKVDLPSEIDGQEHSKQRIF